MFEGSLVAIFVAPSGGAPMRPVDHVEAVAGKGLAGDRYGRGAGTFQRGGAIQPDEEVTLIEEEALVAAARDHQVPIEPAAARRNLLTRDVPLNHLVGRAFLVGEVVLEGLRLCEPCKHLEGLSCPGVVKGLAHRGGLRARIVRGGALRAGDAIRPSQGNQRS
jgi:MOSC domain-containing protein YiiM